MTDIAMQAAVQLRDAFSDYHQRFREITQRAPQRFLQRDWAGARDDAVERIELYDLSVAETAKALASRLGAQASDRRLWAQIRSHYAQLIAPLLDQELNKTFFNTLTRRFFRTRGAEPDIEFIALDIEPTDRITHPVARHSYAVSKSLPELFERALEDFDFPIPYADLRRCAGTISEAVKAQRADWGQGSIRAVELLTTVFYRERRAYLVGRIFGLSHFAPIAIALVNEDQGLRADAVMTEREDLTVLFGFTRAYFHADLETVGDAVVFLRTLLPNKPIDELYTVLGRAKQGKTERYRHFFRHIEGREEQLQAADGERGMVMAVFTLPSYPLVFKIIRDRFAFPKNIVRQDVLDKYTLVFRHDRVGRLVDAQQFRYLRFPRRQFAPEILQELLTTCASSLIEDGDDLIISHLYVERRLRPLNLLLQEAPDELKHRAIVDYGQAIRDLAMSNIFPGDLLLKNFGITRHGRAIFYDYDELCLVTECRFREMPSASDAAEESHHGAWYYVGDNDVFPEQFIEFLGLDDSLRTALLDEHGEIFTVRWWLDVQKHLAGGEPYDLPPYPQSVRL